MSSKGLVGELLTINARVCDGEDFSGRKFASFTAVESLFRRCTFRGSNFSQACFGGGDKKSQYVECVFDKAKITASAPGIVRFDRCSFEGAEIREFMGREAEFVDCRFSGKMSKAVFWGSVVPDEVFSGSRRPMGEHLVERRNEFRGNDFSAADLVDVAFRGGIDLDQQRLPSDGYLYVPDAEHAVNEARKSVIQWKDLEARRYALAVIKALEIATVSGQKQLLINLRGPVPRQHRDTVSLVHEILRNAIDDPESRS